MKKQKEISGLKRFGLAGSLLAGSLGLGGCTEMDAFMMDMGGMGMIQGSTNYKLTPQQQQARQNAGILLMNEADRQAGYIAAEKGRSEVNVYIENHNHEINQEYQRDPTLDYVTTWGDITYEGKIISKTNDTMTIQLSTGLVELPLNAVKEITYCEKE